MRKRFLTLLLLASCSTPPLRKAVPGDLLTFEGKHLERGPVGFGPAELAALPRRTLQGVDPRSGRAGAFEGVDLQAVLLDWIPLKRGADLVVFHGAGGLRVAVPMNALRQHRPVLATVAGGKPVGEWDPGAGPLLLAWPSLESPGLDTDPRQRWWWVRGVTRIDVVAWQEAYGKALRVPPGARDEARLGAEVFASQCLHCHRLRGVGGEAGPDLTAAPAAPSGDALATLLRGHLAARSGMASAPDPGPAAAAQVDSFLQALRVAGPDRPQDEVKEPEQLPPRPPPPAGAYPPRS